ncbi:hypothetical protein F2Q68_00019075 [Brassica cretica]|uniref:Uncharacterized protein n=1 Tax=Brassica cretica TaxID=69181 RepID=A0A8S9FZG4_BRACR|nr:hypothetical protein F2Q68_00019075 [Brassica cretica]
MWREKVQPRVSESNNQHTGTHYIPKGTVDMAVDTRQPLGRNLALFDFPQHTIPTTEEVIEDLIEVTHKYINVPDEAESAARRQRVIQSEKENLMARTAERIIAAANVNLSRGEPFCYCPKYIYFPVMLQIFLEVGYYGFEFILRPVILMFSIVMIGYIAEHPNDEEEVEGIDLHQQRYPWDRSDMDYLYDESSFAQLLSMELTLEIDGGIFHVPNANASSNVDSQL